MCLTLQMLPQDKALFPPQKTPQEGLSPSRLEACSPSLKFMASLVTLP